MACLVIGALIIHSNFDISNFIIPHCSLLPASFRHSPFPIPNSPFHPVPRPAEAQESTPARRRLRKSAPLALLPGAPGRRLWVLGRLARR